VGKPIALTAAGECGAEVTALLASLHPYLLYIQTVAGSLTDGGGPAEYSVAVVEHYDRNSADPEALVSGPPVGMLFVRGLNESAPRLISRWTPEASSMMEWHSRRYAHDVIHAAAATLREQHAPAPSKDSVAWLRKQLDGLMGAQ
jgi:hypothetical protein